MLQVETRAETHVSTSRGLTQRRRLTGALLWARLARFYLMRLQPNAKR